MLRALVESVRYLKRNINKMRVVLEAILVDTREKNPFEFEGSGLEVIREKLNVGDYGIKGHAVVVERKSAADFIGTMTIASNRRRFIREMVRAEEEGIALTVVVETSWRGAHAACIARSGMSPHRMLDSALAISARFRVPFMFAEDRGEAQSMTLSVLRGYMGLEDVR